METRTVTLEGFVNVTETGDDCFCVVLMKPAIQIHEVGSLDIEGVLEDIGIDLCLGDALYNERQRVAMGVLRGCFARAKKAYREARWDHCNWYFKAELDIHDAEDKEPFALRSYEGHPSLKPRDGCFPAPREERA